MSAPYKEGVRLPSGLWVSRDERLRKLDDPKTSDYERMLLTLPPMAGGAPRVYIAGGNNLTVTTKTLILGIPSSTLGFDILRWEVSQSSSSTSGMQRIQSMHVSTLGTPTFTAATITKTVSDDPSSGMSGGTAGAAGTWGVNASTDITTAGIDLEHAFHIFSNESYVWTPPEMHEMKAGNTAGWGLIFPVVPVTATGWNVHVWYAES